MKNKEQEEIHDLIPGKVKIIQNDKYFKFGTDSVLLANFSRVYEDDLVVDFGAGSGVIPFLLAHKKKPDKIIGLEIQPELVALAERNVNLNNLENLIEIREADFREASKLFSAGSIDLVVSNPPYLKIDGGRISKNRHLAIARHELYGSVKDVLREANYLLRIGGILSLVHRSERLPEILSLLSNYNLEAKRLRLVYPRIHYSADRFLLEVRKGGGPGLEVEPPLIVYRGKDQEYTEEVQQMYGAENYDKK
ncbi:MAG: tRNA1(Val) (adenine(37)-N6)-methyltransferase [Halanaerobiales bacterium]